MEQGRWRASYLRLFLPCAERSNEPRFDEGRWEEQWEGRVSFFALSPPSSLTSAPLSPLPLLLPPLPPPPPPPLPSSPLHLSLLIIGYLEGTFDLIWRKQTTDGPGEEEVGLEWKSSATLHEMGMPSEPTKSYLLIRERQDGTTPQRAQQVTAHVVG